MPRRLKILLITLSLLGLTAVYLFIPERDNLTHLATTGNDHHAEILHDSDGAHL